MTNPAQGFITPVRIFLGVLLFAVLFLSRNYGVTYDELAQQEYGQHVYEFFRSGFTNRDSFHYVNLYLYGGLFDGLAVQLQKMLPMLDPYDVRHLLNAFVGWIGFVYVFKLGRTLAGPIGGWISLFLLLLSPMYFGQIANNPKDIPFATFYLVSLYYIIQAVREFPSPSFKAMCKMVVAIGLAINMRVGGILLICYFEMVAGLWLLHEVYRSGVSSLKHCKRVVLFAALSPLIMIPLGTIGWPWAQWQPLIRPFVALTQMSRFGDWNGLLRFNGTIIEAIHVPWTYAPIWFAVTTPLAVAFSLVLALVFARHLKSRWEILFLIFVVCFPVIYVIAKHSVLYNGVRHLIFVYPPLVAIAAAGVAEAHRALKPRFKTPALATGATVLVLGLLAFHPAAFVLRNHPNEVVYFNQLVGGTGGAYKKFDLDYWGNCQKQAVRWLGDLAAEQNRELRVVLEGIVHVPQLELFGANIKLVGKEAPADYRLVAMHDISPQRLDELENDPRIVYRVTADGAPLCIVVNETEEKLSGKITGGF